ncbi:MAG TPA: response regulator [Acidobacteriaceae bacterium]|nr:response regulator [Acidobacteriaceae bacterium]
MPPEQHKPRVLIVDDERNIADTIRAILSHSGYDVVAVYDGQAAVDTARVWTPDVLLSDVMMPGMNGIEAAILISKITPICRILLFSGNLGTGDLYREASAKGHYFEILAKPVHPSELLERLRTLLEESGEA